MPAIAAPAKVLVTGANGFVGLWVVKYLLERGFHVRATVRSAARGESVKKVVGDHTNFEYVVVPDVNEPGAFDEAVKGVEAIQSIGAPLPQEISHPDEILKPAVEGTLSLLESARKTGTVKRIIITSTLLAEVEPKESKYHYTEDDWHDSCLTMLQELGSKTSSFIVYGASKILVERSASDYVKSHQGAINFDVVTLLPTYIFGSPMQTNNNFGKGEVGALLLLFQLPLNEINPDVEKAFSSTSALIAGLTNPAKLPDFFQPDSFVDVRDVAELHVRAMLTEDAAGKRINVVAGEPFSWEAAYNATGLRFEKMPKEVSHKHTYDNSKSIDLFEFKYRSAEEMVRDSWAEFKKRGWVTRDGKPNF